MKNLLFFLMLIVMSNCGGNSTSSQDDKSEVADTTEETSSVSSGQTNEKAWEMMAVAFEGGYSSEEIKTKLLRVIELTDGKKEAELDYNTLLGYGNVLVVMRKESKSGVKEMDILDYMLRVAEGLDGNVKKQIKFTDSAALGAVLLEKD